MDQLLQALRATPPRGVQRLQYRLEKERAWPQMRDRTCASSYSTKTEKKVPTNVLIESSDSGAPPL
jgi:hypothetical protein